MDGVLVDSEQYICQAAIEMFKRKGLTVQPEDFKPFVGQGENAYIGKVAEKYNFPVDIDEVKSLTYQIYGEITEGKLEPLPGVLDFMKKIRDRGLKSAVATSADKVKMEINLKNIGIPKESFTATVNGLEVEHKKPAPDIFEVAAQKMGLNPEHCLVVEDAPSGVEAAKRAGARCLGLTTSFNAGDLDKADWHAANLAEASDEVLDW